MRNTSTIHRLFVLACIVVVGGIFGLIKVRTVQPTESPVAVALTDVAYDAQSTTPLPEDQLDDDAPSWVREASLSRTSTGIHDDHDTDGVVLRSRRYSTVDEAQRELRQLAARRINAYVREDYPLDEHAELPAGLIESAVHSEYVDTDHVDFGTFTADMHRVYWELDLNPELAQKVYPVWREQEVRNRAVAVGVGMGGLTLLLAAFAAVFQIRLRRRPIAG